MDEGERTLAAEGLTDLVATLQSKRGRRRVPSGAAGGSGNGSSVDGDLCTALLSFSDTLITKGLIAPILRSNVRSLAKSFVLQQGVEEQDDSEDDDMEMEEGEEIIMEEGDEEEEGEEEGEEGEGDEEGEGEEEGEEEGGGEGVEARRPTRANLTGN